MRACAPSREPTRLVRWRTSLTPSSSSTMPGSSASGTNPAISAQLDRGALHLDVAECDALALCSAVIESARLRAPAGILVTFRAPTTMAPLRCDESLLRQVLVNLVENALKYSIDGGQVDVRL